MSNSLSFVEEMPTLKETLPKLSALAMAGTYLHNSRTFQT